MGSAQSCAKQTRNEQQIAESQRSEATLKTPFPNIFAIGFIRCDLNWDFPYGFFNHEQPGTSFSFPL
ncbi:MAG TPA: hypothetical protein VMJ12_01570, partial [Candidatus Acidoferrales bacterium]|nr:hypothetical protein [Candidatus Acidoferrales bacterium]